MPEAKMLGEVRAEFRRDVEDRLRHSDREPRHRRERERERRRLVHRHVRGPREGEQRDGLADQTHQHEGEAEPRDGAELFGPQRRARQHEQDDEEQPRRVTEANVDQAPVGIEVARADPA